MDYRAHYDRLIERARGRVLEGYRERHHVVPKCMRGDDSPSNIVDLTAEEHYTAHQLLVKMYPGVMGIVVAAAMMALRWKGKKHKPETIAKMAATRRAYWERKRLGAGT